MYKVIFYTYFFYFSLVLSAVFRFYGYPGPDYKEKGHVKWYKQYATEQWIKDQDLDVWEVLDD